MPTRPLPTREGIIRQFAHGVVQPKADTPLERALILARRRASIAADVGNPYKRSFSLFLRDCVWSIDEARSGEVRKWPWGVASDGRNWTHLWEDFEDSLLRSKLLMIEKSRRVLASWCVCAFDIWLFGGGQDGRWKDEQGFPTLLRSDRNRQVILAARKAKGIAGSEWFLENRIKVLLDLFNERSRDLWPEFPSYAYRCGEIRGSNGSRISAVPQGADQVRGAAATLLHFEELAFWELAQKTVEAATHTLRGGGHLVSITTANAASYAKDVRDGTLRDDD